MASSVTPKKCLLVNWNASAVPIFAKSDESFLGQVLSAGLAKLSAGYEQAIEFAAVPGPGKYVGVLAYAGADWPPANFRVARNIIPYICQTRANWGDPNVVRTSLEQTYAWTKRVDRIGIYEYLRLIPRFDHISQLRTVYADHGGS